MEVIGYTEHGGIVIMVDGVRMTVPDDLGNRHRAEIAEWEFDKGGNRVNTIPAYVPPPPGPYKLYKSTLIRRATATEAEALEVVLNSEEPWLRMMYNSVEYFVSDDALFTYMHYTFEQSLGAERAEVLLSPET